MLEIDGSYLEGGGQIFRNALSLSCILRRPVRVFNIRANRSNPGLSHQHLHGLNLLQQITSAQVLGNKLKSTEVSFTPQAIKSGEYAIIAETAASISLMLQCALPVLAFADGHTKLKLGGGTNVNMAPQVDYMTEVMRPLQELFGFTYDFELLRRGYYPRGGGRCVINLTAVPKLHAIKLTEFGKLREINGWCYVAGKLPLHMATQMKESVETVLQEVKATVTDYKQDIMAYKETCDMATDNGSGLLLCASSTNGCVLGSDALGDARSQPKNMGKSAADELLTYLKTGVCVDHWAQDQIILYMALAEGESVVRTGALTNHTRTAIHVAELMTGVKFQTKEQDGHIIISCLGKGICNNNLKTN